MNTTTTTATPAFTLTPPEVITPVQPVQAVEAVPLKAEVADQVEVHRRLLERLGIRRLHAVVGGSLGGSCGAGSNRVAWAGNRARPSRLRLPSPNRRSASAVGTPSTCAQYSRRWPCFGSRSR